MACRRPRRFSLELFRSEHPRDADIIELDLAFRVGEGAGDTISAVERRSGPPLECFLQIKVGLHETRGDRVNFAALRLPGPLSRGEERIIDRLRQTQHLAAGQDQ
jgi:hypothetical protein